MNLNNIGNKPYVPNTENGRQRLDDALKKLKNTMMESCSDFELELQKFEKKEEPTKIKTKIKRIETKLVDGFNVDGIKVQKKEFYICINILVKTDGGISNMEKKIRIDNIIRSRLNIQNISEKTGEKIKEVVNEIIQEGKEFEFFEKNKNSFEYDLDDKLKDLIINKLILESLKKSA